MKIMINDAVIRDSIRSLRAHGENDRADVLASHLPPTREAMDREHGRNMRTIPSDVDTRENEPHNAGLISQGARTGIATLLAAYKRAIVCNHSQQGLRVGLEREAKHAVYAHLADYELAARDVDRLVRELDVALNGVAGAAPQARLCDIVSQVKDKRWKLVKEDFRRDASLRDCMMKIGYCGSDPITFTIGPSTGGIAFHHPDAPPSARNMCLTWKPVDGIPSWVRAIVYPRLDPNVIGHEQQLGKLTERVEGLEVRDKNSYELLQCLDARLRKVECPTLPADETMEKLKAHAARLAGGHYEPKNDQDAELATLIYDVVERVKNLGKAPKVTDELDPNNPLDALAILFRNDPYMAAAALESGMHPVDFVALVDTDKQVWRRRAKAKIWKTGARKDTDLKPGDLVRYTVDSGCHLRSGAEGYSAAVLVSLAPPVLVSTCGDMVWTATIQTEHLRSHGTAPVSVLIAVMDRLRRDLRDAQDRAESATRYADILRRFPGVAAIMSERVRQVEKEKFSESHDNDHDDHQLARAAACYALPAHWRETRDTCSLPTLWPWGANWWKPNPDDSHLPGRLRELEKAGALIAAEYDRLKNKA